MAVRTYVRPHEYAALQQAADKQAVRLRYLVRTAVEHWVETARMPDRTPEPEPDEPRVEVNVLIPWQLYQSLKQKSMDSGFHMRLGLREALLQWLALDEAGKAPLPTEDGDAAWSTRWNQKRTTDRVAVTHDSLKSQSEGV